MRWQGSEPHSCGHGEVAKHDGPAHPSTEAVSALGQPGLSPPNAPGTWASWAVGVGPRQLFASGPRHGGPESTGPPAEMALHCGCSSLCLQGAPIWAPDLPWGLFRAVAALLLPLLLPPHQWVSSLDGSPPSSVGTLGRTLGGSPSPAQDTGLQTGGWAGWEGTRPCLLTTCQPCCQSARDLVGPGHVHVLRLGLALLPGGRVLPTLATLTAGAEHAPCCCVGSPHHSGAGWVGQEGSGLPSLLPPCHEPVALSPLVSCSRWQLSGSGRWPSCAGSTWAPSTMSWARTPFARPSPPSAPSKASTCRGTLSL